MRSSLLRRLTIIVAGLLVAACGSSASPAPVTAPPPASSPTITTPRPTLAAYPTATPIPAIEHASGPTDVVLRFEEESPESEFGGLSFAPGPEFSLYGDGTVIFRNSQAEPAPAEGSIVRAVPFKVARLAEDQIQSILRFALEDGGLRTARERYETRVVDDFLSTTFTMRAGGLDKNVVVLASLIEPDYGAPDWNDLGPDFIARRAFATLIDHLRNFDRGSGVPGQPWVPDRYRGVLEKPEPHLPRSDAAAWPWPDVAIGQFVAAAGTGWDRRPSRVMSSQEAAMLGLAEISGGVQGIHLSGPDVKTVYSLEFWPMFPDETASPAPAPTPAATPPSVTAGPLRIDGLALVVADRLRARSAPGTGADSIILAEPLTKRSEVFVVAGPVPANGYLWWQVVAVHLGATGTAQFGWVAAAGRDGEIWLAPASVACPMNPSIADLARLGGARSLVCYGRRELQIRAFRLPFSGDGITDTQGNPDWIAGVFGGDGLLDRAVEWHDPTALEIYGRAHPSLLKSSTPYFGGGEEGTGWFDVTGRFDDPVSSECRWTFYDEATGIVTPAEEPALSIAKCRQTFVYTKLRPAPGP